MSNKGMNIQSYDGQDAFYSGTDEEYEEFLRRASENMNFDDEQPSEPESVESTQRINLNETINLQNVIDKFKKTAGGIGHGAKAIKETVAAKIDKLMEKKSEEESAAQEDEAEAEDMKDSAADDGTLAETDLGSGIADKIADSMTSSFKKLDEIKGEMKAMADVPEQVGGVAAKIDSTGEVISALSEKLDGIAKQLEMISEKISDADNENDASVKDMAEDIKSIETGIADVRQSVGSVSRLNDSVFDLKNTQLNTKNAVSNLETAFARLKKKCVLGITVMSILSVIIIALEILLMLS